MNSRKEEIKAAMTAARAKTLWLLGQVPEEFLKRRVHSFYSPIGWHFGHIARTEEYWIICKALGRPCLDEHYTFLFADLAENPKDNRVNLPERAEIIAYLEMVRAATFSALDTADLSSADPFLADGYGWEFALQHECQHQETICEMMQLIQKACLPGGPEIPARLGFVTEREDSERFKTNMVPIPAGSFVMGSDDRHGYDNEKGAHEVHVDAFEIGRTPVTAGQWMEFVGGHGYENPGYWSQEGWAWRCAEDVSLPEYWVEDENASRIHYAGPFGLREINPNEPVSCISWFEAEAFAKFKGMRLPTEEEWEYAARGPSSLLFPWGDELATEGQACHAMGRWGPVAVGTHPSGASPFGVEDMAGNVWEWTSSAFLPYPGFEAFPYDGYSKDHMQGLHRVCRGGSWATSPAILRSSFRNWYVPTYRQGFLGLRLAR
jgi:gamma-glutamyl hercynylcysteine S-oxide synthase